MVEVQNITKRFGDFTAISDISFSVSETSVYGLVGCNGAGKTTLLKTMSGVYLPDGGDVKLFGETVYDNPSVKQRLFYIPDELYFAPFSTLEKMANFYRGYYPKFSMKSFERLTELFELNKGKRLAGFSKGMQRQAELILAFSAHPDVLLLDESFDGLDPAKRSMVRKLMLEYVAEKGCSIIISSHNLHELADICDHLALINGQKIVLDCSVDEMSGSRCRYRVIFDREVETSAFDGIAATRLNKDGKIFTFTAQAENELVEARIAALSPLMTERFPLSLEEIFLEEMEDKDYDLTQIFD